MADRIRRIKACLNGGRHRSEHPAVPLTPSELAADATAAVAAGAEAVHLHPRDRSGTESVDAADIGAAVAAVRLACPAVPIGVSTGLWMTAGDVGSRLASVAAWAGLPSASRPDFASVNLSEPGAADLLAALGRAGIAAEAGVWSVADARAAAAVGPEQGWLRILVELVDASAERAPGEADLILRQLDDSQVTAPRLLHGEGAACWPIVRRAGELGLATRIGFEDTMAGPDGRPARSNAGLVRQAMAAWAAAAQAFPAGSRAAPAQPGQPVWRAPGHAAGGVACLSWA